MSKYYAGIGSRNTPAPVLDLMIEIAKKLAAKGWILRSGGARGADEAFEHGVNSWWLYRCDPALKVPCPKEIFFANDVKGDLLSLHAKNMAKEFHPAWSKMTEYSQRLHARNAFQIMGRDMKTPVDIVICWTPDGCTKHEQRTMMTGGTGTAISIASSQNIRVLNLRNPQTVEVIKKKLEIC